MRKALETEEKQPCIMTWFSLVSSSTAYGLWLAIFIQLLSLSNTGYFHFCVGHTHLERKRCLHCGMYANWRMEEVVPGDLLSLLESKPI